MHSILIKFHVLVATLFLSLSGYADHHELKRADYKSEEAYLKSMMEIAMSAAPSNVSSKATIMGANGEILREGTNGGAQSTDMDLTGVLAIKPQARSWNFTPATSKTSVRISRMQVPLLPRKQCTLHGVQGKTADPGFIVHWSYPPRLSKESKWLAYYVSLSRPRSFKQLLSHGLPERQIIESGPPENIVGSFDRLFGAKAEATRTLAAQAREALGWPVPHDSQNEA